MSFVGDRSIHRLVCWVGEVGGELIHAVAVARSTMGEYLKYLHQLFVGEIGVVYESLIGNDCRVFFHKEMLENACLV